MGFNAGTISVWNYRRLHDTRNFCIHFQSSYGGLWEYRNSLSLSLSLYGSRPHYCRQKKQCANVSGLALHQRAFFNIDWFTSLSLFRKCLVTITSNAHKLFSHVLCVLLYNILWAIG